MSQVQADADFQAQPHNDHEAVSEKQRALLELVRDLQATPPAHRPEWWQEFRENMKAVPVGIGAEE